MQDDADLNYLNPQTGQPWKDEAEYLAYQQQFGVQPHPKTPSLDQYQTQPNQYFGPEFQDPLVAQAGRNQTSPQAPEYPSQQQLPPQQTTASQWIDPLAYQSQTTETPPQQYVIDEYPQEMYEDESSDRRGSILPFIFAHRVMLAALLLSLLVIGTLTTIFVKNGGMGSSSDKPVAVSTQDGDFNEDGDPAPDEDSTDDSDSEDAYSDNETAFDDETYSDEFDSSIFGDSEDDSLALLDSDIESIKAKFREYGVEPILETSDLPTPSLDSAPRRPPQLEPKEPPEPTLSPIIDGFRIETIYNTNTDQPSVRHNIVRSIDLGARILAVQNIQDGNVRQYAINSAAERGYGIDLPGSGDNGNAILWNPVFFERVNDGATLYGGDGNGGANLVRLRNKASGKHIVVISAKFIDNFANNVAPCATIKNNDRYTRLVAQQDVVTDRVAKVAAEAQGTPLIIVLGYIQLNESVDCGNIGGFPKAKLGTVHAYSTSQILGRPLPMGTIKGLGGIYDYIFIRNAGGVRVSDHGVNTDTTSSHNGVWADIYILR